MTHHVLHLYSITCTAAILLHQHAPSEFRQKQFISRNEYRQEQTNIEDLQYYSLVTVGHQVLHAVMDTGSTELIVISDMCKEGCGRLSRLYHPTTSLTHKSGNLSQILSYGSGDLEGSEAYDKFSIGPFTCDIQPFWQITDAKMPLLLHSDFAVIVGLGPIDRYIPVMKFGSPDNERAYAGELEGLNITRYGFCLMQEFGSPGYLIWNDESIIRQPELFTKVATEDPGYWMARLSNVRLGHKMIGCQDNCGAILDSGTSLLALPRDHYNKLATAIKKLGPKCADISNLPNLYFQLDGSDFYLPPDAYIGDVEGFVMKGMKNHFRKSKARCREALMHVEIDSTFGVTWVFGMPFFRSFYTVFQQGNPTEMYLARANKDCQPTSSKAAKLYPPPTQQAARRINAAKLRFSPGVQSALKLGYIGRVVQNLTRSKQ